MGSQKTKTKSQETATTTPNLNPAVSPLVSNYYNGLGNLTPQQLGTPANDLQRSAQSQGMSLPNAANTYAPAISGVQGAMGLLGNVQPAALYGASAPASYSPAQATAASAATPGGYNVQQASVGSYAAPTMATAGNLPGVERVDTSGVTGGLFAQGYQGARARDYMGDYASPYLNDVINATEADMRQSQAADRASYARQGAMNGAFGGSRYGLGETNLLDAQGRTRATMAANLRDQGFQRALAAGQSDAGNINSAGIASMQSANDLAGQRAQIEMQGLLANANNANDMARLGYTTGAENSRFNAGLLNDYNSNIFNATNQANQFNAGQANDAAGRVYSTQADAAQFNAGQANQVGMANAGFANDALGRQYSTAADLNQFNAGAANQNAQFNQNLGLNAAQAYGGMANDLGGLLGNAANLNLNNINTMNSLGNDQMAIDQYNSPAALYARYAELINGGGLLGATTGQTINSNGTSTSKQSGGLGAALLSAAAQAGSAALMASERRVKRDIVKLGEEPDGLGVYSFRYVWDDDAEPLRHGTMVDEVERLRPWALGPVVNGIRTVNMGAL